MKETYFGAIFRKGAESLGYHPYPQPSSNLSRAYTNPLGIKMETCVFCGFCERFACQHYAKGSPQTTILPVLLQNPNYELRTHLRGVARQSRHRHARRLPASPTRMPPARSGSNPRIWC